MVSGLVFEMDETGLADTDKNPLFGSGGEPTEAWKHAEKFIHDLESARLGTEQLLAIAQEFQGEGKKQKESED